MEAPSNFYIVNNPKITTQFHKSQNPKGFMVWAFDDDIPCKILKKTRSGLSMCKGIELRIKDIWFPHILPKDSPNTIGYQSEALCSASRYLNWKGLRWPTIYLYQFDGSHLELISNKQQKKTRVQLSSIAHHAPAKAHRALFHSGTTAVAIWVDSTTESQQYLYSCNLKELPDTIHQYRPAVKKLKLPSRLCDDCVTPTGDGRAIL